jgi:hypothetical protein
MEEIVLKGPHSDMDVRIVNSYPSKVKCVHEVAPPLCCPYAMHCAGAGIAGNGMGRTNTLSEMGNLLLATTVKMSVLRVRSTWKEQSPNEIS